MNGSRSRLLLVSTAVPFLLFGCAKPAAEAMSGETTAPGTARRVNVETQQLSSPCEWLTNEEVAEALGPLQGEPLRVIDAETINADPGGLACAYPVAVQGGTTYVSLQVDPAGAQDMSGALETVGNVIADDLANLGPVEPPPARTDGWDDVISLFGEHAYLMGHVAVRMRESSLAVPQPSLDKLAMRVRAKIADKPFLNGDPNLAGMEDGRDPCALLTRAEAETVLGPLAVDPYRSLKSSAVAEATGVACTYYSSGHRAFTITPEYYGGKESFDIAGMFGKVMRANVGGADEGDLLDGPWESASAGMDGSLHLLEGDRLLSINYRSSPTDMEGAARLAAIAMPRLAR